MMIGSVPADMTELANRGRSSCAATRCGFVAELGAALALAGGCGPAGAMPRLRFDTAFGPLASADDGSGFFNRLMEETGGRLGHAVEVDDPPAERALVDNPKVMILDEPLRGLDATTRELMQGYYLKPFEDTRLSTVFITAKLEEVLSLADRIDIVSDVPSRIVKIVDVDPPRPREISVTATRRYTELKQEALDALYAGRELETLWQTSGSRSRNEAVQ
jgi:hypothetical protein